MELPGMQGIEPHHAARDQVDAQFGAQGMLSDLDFGNLGVPDEPDPGPAEHDDETFFVDLVSSGSEEPVTAGQQGTQGQ